MPTPVIRWDPVRTSDGDGNDVETERTSTKIDLNNLLSRLRSARIRVFLQLARSPIR